MSNNTQAIGKGLKDTKKELFREILQIKLGKFKIIGNQKMHELTAYVDDNNEINKLQR